jgi:hypothetical protein
MRSPVAAPIGAKPIRRLLVTKNLAYSAFDTTLPMVAMSSVSSSFVADAETAWSIIASKTGMGPSSQRTGSEPSGRRKSARVNLGVAPGPWTTTDNVDEVPCVRANILRSMLFEIGSRKVRPVAQPSQTTGSRVFCIIDGQADFGDLVEDEAVDMYRYAITTRYTQEGTSGSVKTIRLQQAFAAILVKIGVAMSKVKNP